MKVTAYLILCLFTLVSVTYHSIYLNYNEHFEKITDNNVFVSRSIASGTGSSCTELFESLFDQLRKLRHGLYLRLKSERPNIIKRALHRVRDFFRYKLQVLHGHPYPVIAIDTSPRAMAWAKHVFGVLDQESRKLVDIAEIQNQLLTKIKLVADYQKDVHQLINRITDLYIQERFLANALKKYDLNAHSIVLEIPQLESSQFREATRVLNYKIGRHHFGSRAQMEIELVNIRRSIKELDRQVFGRAYAQTLAVKELETFRHEFLRQQAFFPSHKVADEYQQIMDAILSFYHTSAAMRLQSQFSPPRAAWEKLKWVHLKNEILSIFLKDIPNLKKQLDLAKRLKIEGLLDEQIAAIKSEIEDLKKLNKFIEGLTEAEKRALGIKEVVDDLSLLKRMKTLRILAGLGALTLGGGFSFKEFYSILFEDQIEKETCAEKTSHQEFVKCADDYLRRKFPNCLLARERVIEDYLNDQGSITNEEVLEEINDLLERRHRFIYGSNVQDSIMLPARTLLAEGDMSSKYFRTKMIRTPGKEEFLAILMDKDPKKGYLAFKFPFAFSLERIRKLVRLYFTEENEVMRDFVLSKLKKDEYAEELAVELEKIYQERQEYLKLSERERELEEKMEQLLLEIQD